MSTDTAPRRPGWFDHPVLSALLAGSWLALSRSVEPVHLLSAALLALIVPRLLHRFLAPASRGLHWPTVGRLLIVVIYDIVKSNLIVARIVLGSMDKPQPAWLPVPLASSHERVNAIFASIITTTPGTVSATIDEARGVIWVHALDCSDHQATIDDMKARYEAPLLTIFRVGEEGQA
ncbi:MAG: monovalent cation/H+ antiporter subunit E [Hydrogenophaga sp.]|nr:monovalent cation/H+ antiporter subunit E [Hydrogenophaga sp.]